MLVSLLVENLFASLIGRQAHIAIFICQSELAKTFPRASVSQAHHDNEGLHPLRFFFHRFAQVIQ
jgi:hypothetical protein